MRLLRCVQRGQIYNGNSRLLSPRIAVSLYLFLGLMLVWEGEGLDVEEVVATEEAIEVEAVGKGGKF